MKLITFILIAAFMQVSASGFSQITLKENNARLIDVVKEIGKRGGLTVVTDFSSKDSLKPVTINLKNVSVEDALGKAFIGQPITYKITDKKIFITDKSFLEKAIHNVESYFAAIDVRGRVLDENGQALIGANVTVKGTKVFSKTNSRGEFFLEKIDEKSILIVTYLGYKLREVLAVKDLGNIILDPSYSELTQVNIVSTGYQTIEKEKSTGSFTIIDNNTFNRTVSPDVLSRLKGVSNGLLFENSTGNALGISVRGRSTIFSNTTPLIVVDNFPFEGDINTLNPDMIENVTLLKDAAAAAIWGVRAGNGVVVITTKRGTLNQSPLITVKTDLTISGKPDLNYIPQLSSNQFIDVEKFLFDNGAYTSIINNGYATISPVIAILNKIEIDPSYAILGNAEIDRLRTLDIRDQQKKYFFRNSSQQRYFADIRGGSSNQTYYFSGGYDKSLPNMIAQSNSRLTLKANNSYNLLNDKITLKSDITLSKSEINNENANGYTPYLPYEQIADQSGSALEVVRSSGLRVAYTDTAGKGKLLDWKFRPLDDLNGRYSSNTNNSVDYRVNLGVSYKIIRPLVFSLNYQYYNATTKIEDSHDEASFFARNRINSFTQINSVSGVVTRPLPVGDIFSPTFISNVSNYGRGQFDFNETYNSKHLVSAILGYEIRSDRNISNRYTLYGYLPETATNVIVDNLTRFPDYTNGSFSSISPDTRQFELLNRYLSLYSSASYTYNEKYVISASYRKDESNLFGVKANQKGVPLWSTGVNWNLHKEKFFNLNWLSMLQFRATFGYNGNVNNSISAYLTASPSSVNNPLTRTRYFEIINPPNDNLRWERVKNFNTGVYFSAKNNRISGSIEYYNKNGFDLIATSPIAPQTGVSLFTGNTANTTTAGLDVQINTNNIKGNFIWNTITIFNFAKDKITDYKVAVGSNSNIVTSSTYSLAPIKSFPINSIFAYKWAGLDALGNPQSYLDGSATLDYTKVRNSTDVSQLDFLGSATPTYFGSIRNAFNYRAFELSFNITYKLGYYFRRPSLDYSSLFNGGYMQADYDLRWQNSGDEIVTDVPSAVYPTDNNRNEVYLYSASLVDNAGHFRLQDIQFNYTFNKRQFKKMPFSSVNIYMYATNLGLIWKASKNNLDPDFRANYPNPRSLAFGIRTNF